MTYLIVIIFVLFLPLLGTVLTVALLDLYGRRTRKKLLAALADGRWQLGSSLRRRAGLGAHVHIYLVDMADEGILRLRVIEDEYGPRNWYRLP